MDNNGDPAFRPSDVLNGLNDLNCLNEFIRVTPWRTKII
jgi:hypothetical protein